MLTLKTTAEYNHWFSNQSLKEQGQIKERLKNIKINSHFGIVRKINKNLAELKWKNGRRVYFTKGIGTNRNTVILLLGGHKNTQLKDIKKLKSIMKRLADSYEKF